MFIYIVLTPISTTSGLWNTGNTRKYQQIDVYIYQCGDYQIYFIECSGKKSSIFQEYVAYVNADIFTAQDEFSWYLLKKIFLF